MKKFLLHTCCAPCSIAIIDELKSKYDLTVFFYNPNIYPEEEYLKRLAAVETFCRIKGIELICGPYDSREWLERAAGLEEEPEGGKRCELCFTIRLMKTALFAAQQGINTFATTLSISPHKDTGAINRIGLQAAEKYTMHFAAEDFKQDNGYRKSCELSKQYGLYRQKYCGCMFSNNSTPARRDRSD